MKDIVMIQLKDICNYNDDFEYEPMFICKDADFEEKYNGLVDICKNYECFEDIADYINDNFNAINVEIREIRV